MTSATLAVGRDAVVRLFQVAHRADAGRPASAGAARSTIQRQAELVLVDGMPDPTPTSERYEQAAIEMIRRYVARTDGHAFVLFTSYDMLTRAAAELTPWLAERNLGLLSQADGMPRSQMLERFQRQPAGACCSAPTASGKASTCRATRCRT